MKKKIKKTCPRCQTVTYLEEHHILPKCTFNGKGETVWLCPNCHNEFHIELGIENLKITGADFHREEFWKWFTIVVLLLLFFGVYFFVKQYDSIIQFCQNL